MSTRVLVAESDSALAESRVPALERAGYAVRGLTPDGATISADDVVGCDLIVIDLALERAEGGDLLRAVRRITTRPVVAVTPSDREVDRVVALELGADVCLSHPSEAELVAHLRALVRRCEYEHMAPGSLVREVGGLRMNFGTGQVTADRRVVQLTLTQFKLLDLLSESPGRIVSRREILQRLWDMGSVADSHVCDVHVSNLRHKLERDPTNPERILTVRGQGYRLVAS